MSTYVDVVGVSVASRFGHMLPLGRGVARLLTRLRTVERLFTLRAPVEEPVRASDGLSCPKCTRAPPTACEAVRGAFGRFRVIAFI